MKAELDPFNYCSENAWVFLFDPFHQTQHLIEKKLCDHECIRCKKTKTIESNGWNWRPQHHGERVDWVLHRRIHCHPKNGGCGKTFAEFHPEFMSQLPNAISEMFPFLATASGLGIHESMMYQFLHLCTKGILFGTYCGSINEAKMTRYWKNHLCYLDRLSDKIKKLGRNRSQWMLLVPLVLSCTGIVLVAPLLELDAWHLV